MNSLSTNLRLEEMTITFRAPHGNIPPEIVAVAASLIEKLSKKPKEALVSIESLIKKHPDTFCLRNWRLVASSNAGMDYDSIKAIIVEDYQQMPDYLFSKFA